MEYERNEMQIRQKLTIVGCIRVAYLVQLVVSLVQPYAELLPAVFVSL